MADIIKELQKVMLRRKQDGGEFSYVLIPDGESIAGKKAAFTNLKDEKSEEFAKIKSLCKKSAETDDAFDKRVLGLLPTLPFEKEDKEMEVDGEESGGFTMLSAADMFRVVRVDGLEKAASKDDVESFFSKEFEGVVKAQLKVHPRNKTRKSWWCELTFKDEAAASVFLAKDEIKYKGKKLKTQLLMDNIQFTRVTWAFNQIFAQNLRLMDYIPTEKDKEDTYIMVHGIGQPTVEELQSYFMGVESEFENIVSVKSVVQNSGEGAGKLFGVLVQFENKAALEKFTEMGEVKYKDKVVRYNIMSEVNNELKTKKVNYMVDDGPTTQELANRRLIVLRLKEKFSPAVEKKLKSQFSEARNIRYCPMGKVAIITFAAADIANKAIRNQSDDSDLVAPLDVMPLAKYLEIREKLLEQGADKIERIKKMYEEIKDNPVIVDGNVIKISISMKQIKKVDKKVKKEKEKVTKETKKVEVKEVVAKQQLPTNPILRKRANRGKNAFDTYVAVRGFNQPIRNMGKATDMDICNYFIHNHKDVSDVKFVNWTDIVFARFWSAEAAEKFISLSYHLFYGVTLRVLDVVEFLKQKNDVQKEEVARVLLGRRFMQKMLEGSGGVTTNGAGAAKAGQPKTDEKPEMELGSFSTKQAGSGLRELVIENLHLDAEDVGQPKWMKSGDEGFKARFAIKMDDNAIGYFVKKWNELEISVAGKTVMAELTVQPPKVRAPKRNHQRSNNPNNKRAKIE